MPEDAYARSKLAGEMAIAEATYGGSMQIVTIRPPLVYGPGMAGHFAQLMNIVHRGLPLPLANINNRRSLIYVGNLADAIARCIEDERAAGRTFLVSDDTLSTPELIHRLAKAMSRPTRLFPFPAGLLRMIASAVGAGPKLSRLVDSLQVDSNTIRNTLEWRPPYTTAAGLSATVTHWRRHSQSTTHT
ncbi:MAG: hypothetical protein IOMNBAOH_01735 [Rhodocyclaceae bacterium]|nr:hypothetical protein [Rhodocyclaceae bacterium]